MTIQVAKTAGFCFGVRNALELVEKRAAEKNGKTLYTIGPLIHMWWPAWKDRGLKQ